MFEIIKFFANVLGYLLNALYNLCGNFGIAIILFTVVTKVLLIPLIIKQQKETKKMAKVQPLLVELQEKYRNDQQRYMEEYTKIQRDYKFNPFSGCLLSLIQIPIILSMFYMVSNPLTYMKKMDATQIEQLKTQWGIVQNTGRYYPEIEIIKKDSNIGINLDFLGINLGDVPAQNKANMYLLIIPVLSVLVTVFSMLQTNRIQKEMNKDNPQFEETQKSIRAMNFMLPVLSGYIAYQVPLGLGLYWLTSNILQIVQQKFVKYYMKKEEEIING